MTCFLFDDKQHIITGQETVMRSCLQQLQVISGAAQAVITSQCRFPTLPPLTFEEVDNMQRYCASGKALALDAISDTWMRQTQRKDLLCNLWNADALTQMSRSFEARLVPLNKVWPDIPSKEQFRPIVILSPLFKWLEIRFTWKLSNYLTL